ncbi:LuxR C-terminal-related transcriptional regulator [Scandinavium sp. NPDC088450]|uniref:helix-turn-helix transcriptional regulator n=1 Tax=Scandinavium sp. NPDC088450 TaxID=3364514 RepID=UPI00384B6D9A
MANYNVLSLSAQSIWVQAIGFGLTHLARTNPGWSYLILSKEEEGIVPNLYILDLTANTDIDVQALPVVNSRLLVLVHAYQRRLIKKLQQESRCSLLCVDEHFLNFREIIESSARHKRFMSPFIRELLMQQPVPVDEIKLTETESKVLKFIRNGKNGVEISQALFRSQKTISSHKRNIMRKLGVSDDLGLKQKILAMEESAR